jgi:outer membrane protein
MKKKLCLTLALLLSLFNLYAKEKPSHIRPLPLKIGYADMEYIFDALPEKKTIESEYTSFEKQLNNQLKAGIEDLQQKAKTLEQGYETMTEAVRNQQELELQQLHRKFQQLQLELQEKLASKQSNLLKPVYEKIQSTIAQVAKDKDYTYVLSANAGGMSMLLYANEENNISDWVLQKLGIDLDKTEGKKK